MEKSAAKVIEEKREVIDHSLSSLKNIVHYYFTGNEVPESFDRDEAMRLFLQFIEKERQNSHSRLDAEIVELAKSEAT